MLINQYEIFNSYKLFSKVSMQVCMLVVATKRVAAAAMQHAYWDFVTFYIC